MKKPIPLYKLYFLLFLLPFSNPQTSIPTPSQNPQNQKYIQRKTNQNSDSEFDLSNVDLSEISSPFKQSQTKQDMSIGTALKASKFDEDFNEKSEKSEPDFPMNKYQDYIMDSIDMDNFFDIISFPYKGTLETEEESYSHLIIQIDYSNLKNLSRIQKIFLRMFIMPRALENIATLIRIKFRNELNFTKKQIENCNDEFIKVPSFYKNNELFVDLVVFVNSIELADDTFAMTSSCVFSPSLGRTVAANLIYNSRYLDLTKQGIEDAVETVQHEMIHAFVFDDNMIRNLPNNSNGEEASYIDEKGRRFLRGDEIIKQAQEYFGCNVII
jgi:hypothetical protein